VHAEAEKIPFQRTFSQMNPIAFLSLEQGAGLLYRKSLGQLRCRGKPQVTLQSARGFRRKSREGWLSRSQIGTLKSIKLESEDEKPSSRYHLSEWTRNAA
jgi:hypothetical protein